MAEAGTNNVPAGLNHRIYHSPTEDGAALSVAFERSHEELLSMICASADNRRKAMKIAASLGAVILIASPALAQNNTTATTTKVHSTTREIHATNVPVHHTTHHHATHHYARHHAMHCNHVTRHEKTYCEKTHHVVVKKSVTTTTTHS
jgi:hypothetical protein